MNAIEPGSSVFSRYARLEFLGRDSAERRALLSLLGTQVDLETRAQCWSETHHRAPKPEVKQLGLELWGEE